MLVILAFLRRINDVPPVKIKLDLLGSGLSVVGLSMVVFGVLRSSEWGWVNARPGMPQLFGASLVIWLIVGGLAGRLRISAPVGCRR